VQLEQLVLLVSKVFLEPLPAQEQLVRLV
jgi:hypothetical protein